MSGIFAPRSDGYAPLPLLAGEQIVREQTASVDGKSVWGGLLVLTNQRLLFRPINVKGMDKLIKDGIDFLPESYGVLGKVVGKALDYVEVYQDGTAGAVDVAAIASVTSGKNAGPFHPPSLVVSMTDGAQTEVGILKSKMTPNISPSNNVARDEMIALIQQQLVDGGLA